MNYLKISIGVLIALSASRFVPHPPNFTSLIALSFYVPALLGKKYISIPIIAFAITDIFIGFHQIIFFTWGSILIISFLSFYFKNSVILRISGAMIGATIFFVFSNFGVWLMGSYGYTFEGLLACYILAIPFFAYSFLSTFIFSGLIEIIYNYKKIKNFFYYYKY